MVEILGRVVEFLAGVAEEYYHRNIVINIS